MCPLQQKQIALNLAQRSPEAFCETVRSRAKMACDNEENPHTQFL